MHFILIYFIFEVFVRYVPILFFIEVICAILPIYHVIHKTYMYLILCLFVIFDLHVTCYVVPHLILLVLFNVIWCFVFKFICIVSHELPYVSKH
jgi:hypothetical protein